MSLEDLGNLGEAIGSFGLLVTVVFFGARIALVAQRISSTTKTGCAGD